MTEDKKMLQDPLSDPRLFLRALFDRAVSAALHPESVLPPRPKGRLVVIGVGKAAMDMAVTVEAHYGYDNLSGLVVVPYGQKRDLHTIRVLEAAHPVPDENGMQAARYMLEMLEGLEADDLVIALISGGGSALLPLPLVGLTLADKQDINRQLLRSGATISEMNIIRRHLSTIKGGRLGVMAHPARMLSLMISDVTGDHPWDIASGPTVGDPSSCLDALEIAERYDLALPEDVIKMWRSGKGESPKPDDLRLAHHEWRIVAAPMVSLEAAAEHARRLGVPAYILGDMIEGESRDVGRVLAGLSLSVARHDQPFAAPCVLLCGGETTVTIRGTGLGGRNVECLLSFALACDGHARIHGLMADTDGVDGGAPIAGAYYGPDTLVRARQAGIHPPQALSNNDGHGFFSAIGDSLITGPTGTNVNDFRAILII